MLVLLDFFIVLHAGGITDLTIGGGTISIPGTLTPFAILTPGIIHTGVTAMPGSDPGDGTIGEGITGVVTPGAGMAGTVGTVAGDGVAILPGDYITMAIGMDTTMVIWMDGPDLDITLTDSITLSIPIITMELTGSILPAIPTTT
jgi:hypothetical protein